MGQIIYENLDEALQQKIDSGSITLPISADSVNDSPTKTFVSPAQRAMIDSNSAENASQTVRISAIEQQLSTIDSGNDKVAMTALDTAMYLSELIDDVTIKNINGKLTVEALRGLLSSVVELNFLQGTTSNIQQQINNLSGVSVFRGVFSSFADLQLAPDPQPGQYAIVSDNTTSDYYFYYNSMWGFSHSTTGSTDIDINSGTTGILDKTRYVHQSATETSFTDPTGQINATNTNAAIVEVFRFADSLLKGLTQTVGSPLSQTDSIDINLRNFKNWYANIAEAITLKGINTNPSNNGDEIIQKIKAIPNVSVEGVIKRKSKINLLTGDSVNIQLTSAISVSDITSTLIEFVAGTSGVVAYNLEFNNGDADNFEPNQNIEFDGKMRIKTNFDITMDKDIAWIDEGYLYSTPINITKFNNINSMAVN